jgi:aminopeptidase N
MRRLLPVLLILFCISLRAQIPKIDPQFKQKLIEQKALHYQQMVRCEQQKTANQHDYDIKYYALNLTPDLTAAVVNGVVNVAGEVLTTSLDQVELNFWDGMSIDDIYPAHSPGSHLNYTRNNDILTIQLDKTYSQGESFNLEIVYHGQPQNSNYYSFSFDSYNGHPMIWTLSSVFGARAWWPCKDVPSDKPDSVDIRVTVPGNLIAVSNGALRGTSTNGNYTTYWWHEGYPIATYLVFLAIHPYEVNYDDYIYHGGADTMKIRFYTFPGNYEQYAEINAKVTDILALYSSLFGEYPFVDEKYGQADFLWSGGMEHQTCTTYGRWNEGLYAHEIAHQWWGDMITCNSFHHIWLNEGFASYTEAFWFEHLYPGYTASEYQMDYQLYLGPGTVYVEDPENENIFDLGLSYYKGSWVLHMLRHITGDNTFFNILRTYYASPVHQYGTATTEDFQAICQAVSGINLEKFFQQWIYEEYYPNYSYSWNWIQNGPHYDIQLEIEQLQNNHIFWMPIDITVTTTQGETTLVVWDSLATQSFQLMVNAEPLDLELDKYNWILKTIEEPFVNPQFDQGILLVNGVDFETYGQEIWECYQNRAFSGNFRISFWDSFDTPNSGYPSTLPEPMGHGMVPAEVLGRYSTVIWIGNHYNGDVGKWQQTSILAYLKAGGNILLLTRLGRDFIYGELQEYLGITWAENPECIIWNCAAVYPGLQDNLISAEQSYNAVFETDFSNSESILLFQEPVSFSVPRGLGVWHKPAAGGNYRSEGGNFVFLSGRPYRYDASRLRTNVEYILENFFHEPSGTLPDRMTLYQNYPNPFNGSTTIPFYLERAGQVELTMFNTLGQKVKTLFSGNMATGDHVVSWDGNDEAGNVVASGIYIYHLRSDGSTETRKMVLLK